MHSLQLSAGLVFVFNFLVGTIVHARFLKNNVLAKTQQQAQGKCLRKKKSQANRYVHCFYETEDDKDCSKEVGWYDKSKERKGDSGEQDANDRCGGDVEADHVQALTELSFESGLSEQHAKKMARMLYSLADSGSKPACPQMTGCFDCVRNGCAWTVGRCMDNCNIIADAPCYSRSNKKDESSREICKRYNDKIKNANACLRRKSCDTCVATTLPSDRSRTCMWYGEGDFGNCISECGMMGCGETTCGAGTQTTEPPDNEPPEVCETFFAGCSLEKDGPEICACNARSSKDPRDICDLQTDDNLCICAMCVADDGESMEDKTCAGKAATKIGGKCQLVEDECEMYQKTCVKSDEEGICGCGARSIYVSNRIRNGKDDEPAKCAECQSGQDEVCKGFTATIIEGKCQLVEDECEIYQKSACEKKEEDRCSCGARSIYTSDRGSCRAGCPSTFDEVCGGFTAKLLNGVCTLQDIEISENRQNE